MKPYDLPLSPNSTTVRLCGPWKEKAARCAPPAPAKNGVRLVVSSTLCWPSLPADGAAQTNSLDQNYEPTPSYSSNAGGKGQSRTVLRSPLVRRTDGLPTKHGAPLSELPVQTANMRAAGAPTLGKEARLAVEPNDASCDARLRSPPRHPLGHSTKRSEGRAPAKNGCRPPSPEEQLALTGLLAVADAALFSESSRCGARLALDAHADSADDAMTLLALGGARSASPLAPRATTARNATFLSLGALPHDGELARIAEMRASPADTMLAPRADRARCCSPPLVCTSLFSAAHPFRAVVCGGSFSFPERPLRCDGKRALSAAFYCTAGGDDRPSTECKRLKTAEHALSALSPPRPPLALCLAADAVQQQQCEEEGGTRGSERKGINLEARLSAAMSTFQASEPQELVHLPHAHMHTVSSDAKALERS
ncbi:hypothetical protein AB1Y20_022997 [Prymnesium parvum]|uniref:Uncharacterized protein n=1 Tax=Prymnesium parvum TaxID=97485 RepID=A0AB34JEW0_PRYPA